MIKKDAEADGKWVSDCGISQMKWLANTSAWTPYLPLPRTRNLEEAPSRIDMTTIGNEQTETTICERETQIRSQLPTMICRVNTTPVKKFRLRVG